MADRTIIEYNAEIERRAAELIDSGDLDAITAHMQPVEFESYRHALRVMIACKLTSSRNMAIDEIRDLIDTAAMRCARAQYYAECQQAAQKLALDRFYSHVGVPA